MFTLVPLKAMSLLITPILSFNFFITDIQESQLSQYNFNFENDFMFETDEYYNHNTKMDFIFKGKYFIYSVDVKQALYTPTFHELDYLVEGDMKYTSIAETELGIHNIYKDKRLTSFKIGLGYTGKYSGGKETMETVHSILPAKPEFNAWDTQEEKLTAKFSVSGFQKQSIFKYSDIIFNENLTLGNIKSFASVGTQLRVGLNLPRSFGLWSAETNKLNYNNLSKYDTNNEFSLYAVVGGHYNYIMNDYTLRDLDINHNLFQFNYGFEARYKKLSVSLLHTRETDRFKTQIDDSYGYTNIMISYSF
jgi:hypothetical protein